MGRLSRASYQMLRIQALGVRQDLSPVSKEKLNYLKRSMFTSEIERRVIRIRLWVQSGRGSQESFNTSQMPVYDSVDEWCKVVVVDQVNIGRIGCKH